MKAISHHHHHHRYWSLNNKPMDASSSHFSICRNPNAMIRVRAFACINKDCLLFHCLESSSFSSSSSMSPTTKRSISINWANNIIMKGSKQERDKIKWATLQINDLHPACCCPMDLNDHRRTSPWWMCGVTPKLNVGQLEGMAFEGMNDSGRQKWRKTGRNLTERTRYIQMFKWWILQQLLLSSKGWSPQAVYVPTNHLHDCHHHHLDCLCIRWPRERRSRGAAWPPTQNRLLVLPLDNDGRFNYTHHHYHRQVGDDCYSLLGIESFSLFHKKHSHYLARHHHEGWVM